MSSNPALDALRRNVTGKVESGEAEPIVAVELDQADYTNPAYAARATGDLLARLRLWLTSDLVTTEEKVEGAVREISVILSTYRLQEF